MSKVKSKEFIDSSHSDSDSDVEVKKKQKQKKVEKKAEKRKSKDVDSDSDKEVKKQKKEKSAKKKRKEDSKPTDGENAIDGFELGRDRKINVMEFKGKKLVNIREYYTDNAGDLKPGRKGISLTPDQWEKLLEVKHLVNDATPGDDDAKEGWQLGKCRKVSLNEFKGKTLIDIREYYTTDSGDMKPGKRGISLSLDQWDKVLENAETINDAL